MLFLRAETMEKICDHLKSDHRHCDDLLARAAAIIEQRNWQDAGTAFRHFCHVLRRHMKMEEEVLFPACEAVMIHSSEPIAMLRIEHEQIHGIIERMSWALCRLDAVDFLLHSETFTILIQEHGMKEDKIVYPMLDRILSGRRSKIIEEMRKHIDTPRD